MIRVQRWRWLVPATFMALLVGSGCATGSAGNERGQAPLLDEGGGFGFWEKKDFFQSLQEASEIREEERHPSGEAFNLGDAKALWEELARAPVTLQNFGPRRTLTALLREQIIAGEGITYEVLLSRCQAYARLVVMRPDGYLVVALTGKPLQRMGRIVLRDGRLSAGNFEVGAFYLDKGGVFFPVDSALQRAGWVPLGELALERDWFNAALDGASDALLEMALALEQLVTEPIQSLEGLAQLPSAVAALIASSPEYFARYSTRPLQEQIREAARLSTHLVMLYGSAAGTATRTSTAGASVPVLSLTATGALAVERLALPMGAQVTALGAGSGAVYVLMAPQRAPSKGSAPSTSASPGQWKHKKFSGSTEARRYQEQISGRSADEVYFIGEVEYDGFIHGVLKEAKGSSYLKFFEPDGQPKYWYANSGGFDGLMSQARAQSRAAEGIRLEWHVAERALVDILQRHFREARITHIHLVHTPPVH